MQIAENANWFLTSKLKTQPVTKCNGFNLSEIPNSSVIRKYLNTQLSTVALIRPYDLLTILLRINYTHIRVGNSDSGYTNSQKNVPDPDGRQDPTSHTKFSKLAYLDKIGNVH